jgi:hypothetical protein
MRRVTLRSLPRAICLPFVLLFSLGLADRADATELGVSVAALAGHAFDSSTSCGGSSTCPYGFAFGVRAGLRLPALPVYVGATFVNHFGYSEDLGNGRTRTANGYFPGVEAGYEFKAGPLVLRPYVGVGVLFTDDKEVNPTLSGQLASVEEHHRDPAFWPGATVLLGLDEIILGVDARYMFSTEDALALFGTVGVRF